MQNNITNVFPIISQGQEESTSTSIPAYEPRESNGVQMEIFLPNQLMWCEMNSYKHRLIVFRCKAAYYMNLLSAKNLSKLVHQATPSQFIIKAQWHSVQQIIHLGNSRLGRHLALWANHQKQSRHL